MISIQDAEAVDSGRVTDGVGFAIVSNVRILSDTFVISAMKIKNQKSVFCVNHFSDYSMNPDYIVIISIFTPKMFVF